MVSPLRISNKTARGLWLSSHGLSNAPTGPLDTLQIIKDLGFVQLDTIQILSRAHHHILWNRNQNYREKHFDPLLAKDRAVFEHFTHDASVLPMDSLPYWKRQFTRMRAQMLKYKSYGSIENSDLLGDIKTRIWEEGALSTRDFQSAAPKKDVAWARPQHKLALDFLWYSGELATCFRENFIKHYNLADRVFPQALRDIQIDDDQQINWLSKQALDRLGFATAMEIKNFWDATTRSETTTWINAQSNLVPVEVQTSDGEWRSSVAVPDIEARIETLKPATSRLRILNPFDPAIRDRDRLKRLFAMDYKIEIFVPEAKRQYGYYIYPLLEGDRIVGRIEARADRSKSELKLIKLWAEPTIKWTEARDAKLTAELDRMARFIGVNTVVDARTATTER